LRHAGDPSAKCYKANTFKGLILDMSSSYCGKDRHHYILGSIDQSVPISAHTPLTPSIRSKTMLSDMTLSALVRGMNEIGDDGIMPWLANDGRPIVVHGFRSSFRVWCEEETSTPRAVSEAALAHSVENKVEAAYNRTDHFEKRRVLMDQWANHCYRQKAV
jgi:integrase